METNNETKVTRSVLLGAAFLMATSAIGPGFLTQTATFTGQLGATFGFVILISVLISYIAQMNIWRVIAVSGTRAQDIANKVAPGLGYVIAILVALGGLVFNIGNVGGTALGINAIFPSVSISLAGGIGGALGVFVFLSKRAGRVMDRLTQILGAIMIVLILIVAVTTNPPLGEAAYRTVMPATFPVLAIITLVGGTVGGYIPFSGGHRLVDAGITGESQLKQVNQSATMGIGVAALVRVLLFLAVLGVVSRGLTLNPSNPAGSAFEHALGPAGLKIFGVVFLAAAITSVVGAAYTSISFLKTLVPVIGRNPNLWTIVFIFVSTIIAITAGNPAQILVLVGTANGFILPITLAVMLVASQKSSIIGSYRHPKVLFWLGWLVVALMSGLALRSIYLMITG